MKVNANNHRLRHENETYSTTVKLEPLLHSTIAENPAKAEIHSCFTPSLQHWNDTIDFTEIEIDRESSIFFFRSWIRHIRIQQTRYSFFYEWDEKKIKRDKASWNKWNNKRQFSHFYLYQLVSIGSMELHHKIFIKTVILNYAHTYIRA